MWLNSILIVVVVGITLSCAGYSDIVEDIENSSKEIQAGNVGILNSISEKKLRVANDSQSGTLYYAGLLWYFKDDREKAIIAFKRSARTSVDPWKKESARLVGALYSSTFEYGPLFYFYESLHSLDFFASDPELFYYYAMSMWSLREYDNLAELVKKAQMATWKRTPKHRVSVLEARFALQFWKYLLDGINQNNTSLVTIETLLLENSAYPLVHSIPFFLERVSDTIHVPDEVYMLIKAKTIFLDDTQAALEVYLDLPKKYLLHQKTLSDLIVIAQKSHKDLQPLQIWLLDELNNTTIEKYQKMHVLASLAYVLYLRDDYNASAKYYRKFFSLLYAQPDSIVNSNLPLFIRSFRSFLYITIRKEPHHFIDRYIRFASLSLKPELFARTLEEYLYEMLVQNKYSQLEKDLQKLSDLFHQSAIQLELLHWRSILSLVNNSVYIESVPKSNTYRSVFTYDFFITQDVHKDMDAELFFKSWFPDLIEEENNGGENTDSPQNSKESTVNLLVGGHIKFGLFDYAYSMSLANISLVSFKHIKQIYAVMTNNTEHYKAYVLANKVAYFTPQVFSHVEDLFLIYPQAYKEIVHSLTENSIERSLLFGLMREESSYSPTIRSSANAVGLTQLLAATAKDIAERINYGEFSIVHPKDNLTLGYEYFKYLVRVLKNPIKAILAYNGGLGNVWKWEESLDTSNLLLFAAQVPFRETRRYIRKVLSSAMIYGMLYYDVEPKELLAYVSKGN